MSDNILKDIKIKDIESGVPFTAYFGCNGTQYIIRRNPIGFESEPMEVTIAINYHQYAAPFTNIIDEESEFVMVDKINIKMHMHSRHIDVELVNALTEKDKRQKIYLWACTYDSSPIEIYPLMFIMDKCWHVLSEMEFQHIMSLGGYLNPTNEDIMLRKSIIHGIVTSETQELAERCLEYRCSGDMSYVWDSINQEFFDTNCQAVCILIEELVNHRPELLRMIPLRLRILLITHFNAEGKHEIVAALNYYHRGDYRNPGKDLVL